MAQDTSHSSVSRTASTSSTATQSTIKPRRSEPSTFVHSRITTTVDQVLQQSGQGISTEDLAAAQPSRLAIPETRTRKHERRKSKANRPVDKPVLVRAYSPAPQSSIAGGADEYDEEEERIELPPIEAFSFGSITKAVEPKMTRTMETIQLFSSNYRSNLSHEADLLVQAQETIDRKRQDIERLTTRTKATKTKRNQRLKTDTDVFNGGATVEELVKSAEKAYTAVESIVATLQAMNALLPQQEQVATSPHIDRFPLTNALLERKGTFKQALPSSSESSSTKVASPSESSSGRTIEQPGPSSGQINTLRSGSYFAQFSAYGPPLSRVTSPPVLELRTVTPKTTDGEAYSTTVNIAASAAAKVKSSFSLRNIFWGSPWRGSKATQNGEVSSTTVVASRTSSKDKSAESQLKKIMDNQTSKRTT